MLNGEPTIGRNALTLLAQLNEIPAVSFASSSASGEIQSTVCGNTGREDPIDITNHTIFEAASLSKPVFAYIVLKMAQRGELDLDKPLLDILQEKFGKDDSRAQFGPPTDGIRNNPNYAQLTARQLLSHQAALPNEFIQEPAFLPDVTAGTNFDYSGEAFRFLNEVIEKMITPKTLEQLAQEEFAKPELNMTHTSFLPPADTNTLPVGHFKDGTIDQRQHFYVVHPAGSLHTTPQDYCQFLNACVNDEFIKREMFTPCVKGLNGKDTVGMASKVPEEALSNISWGFGIGLQQCPDGTVVAFHWGDGAGTCRNFAAVNLTTNNAVACFTNSANGPSVFRTICEPIVGDLTAASQWLSLREHLPMNPKPLSQSEAMSSNAHIDLLPTISLTPSMTHHIDKQQREKSAEPSSELEIDKIATQSTKPPSN